MNELTEKEALYKAAAYCSTTEHCLSEVREKLRNWGVTEEVGKQILKHLTNENYVNEERYCRSFVNDKFKFSKWGKVKISQALRQKQLNSVAILDALATIDDGEYTEILRSLIAAKRRSVKAKNEYELNGKLIRFALSRGFELHIIQQHIQQAEWDETMD